MGAWGSGPFQNDAALDWLARAKLDPQAVELAFERATGPGYLDVDDGASAVAAAAVVAAAVDGDDAGLAESGRAVARELRVDAELRSRAVAALDATLGPSSELRSLWDEGPAGARFRVAIAALRARLVPPA